LSAIARLAGKIVIRTNERRLYFILDANHAKRCPVGVGKAGKQWAGATQIDGKYRNPAWSPPAEVNADITDFYWRVSVGTPVVVTYRALANKTTAQFQKSEAMPFFSQSP
jgi:lipoprotein-anchoring transpeptidase ErfK/SrfK